MAEPPRRRLPVLQSPTRAAAPDPRDDEERPPWHWVGFGVVAIFAVWLPLSYAAQAVTGRLLTSHLRAGTQEELAARLAEISDAERLNLGVWLAIPHMLALALAAFGGGLLVGRFGVRTTVREAASAGAGAALVAVALTIRDAGLSWTMLVTFVVATACAAWGGGVGIRLRRHPSATT